MDQERKLRDPLFLLLLSITNALFMWLCWKSIREGAKLAGVRWRKHPFKMIGCIVLSFAVGQAIFWRHGYDQLGGRQNSKVKFGKGEAVAATIYPHLPHTKSMSWFLKLLEVLTDVGKAPLEAATFAKYWIMPDAWAFVVTQPGWSIFEGAEKAASALRDPSVTVSEGGTKQSLECIYGNVFRFGQSALILLIGGWLTKAYKKFRIPG